MDEDDISILPDLEEDNNKVTESVSSHSEILRSRRSTDLTAPTAALQDAYKDLLKRYNEGEQKNISLRRKLNSLNKMASENGFSPHCLESGEQGAAAMPETTVSDQVRQGLINHLQRQLDQNQTKQNILQSELQKTQQQFAEFRAKHARCSQEKEVLNNQIKYYQELYTSETPALKEKISRLEKELASKEQFHSGKTMQQEESRSYPASFPPQKGAGVVSLEDYNRVQHQLVGLQKNMQALCKVLQQTSMVSPRPDIPPTLDQEELELRTQGEFEYSKTDMLHGASSRPTVERLQPSTSFKRKVVEKSTEPSVTTGLDKYNTSNQAKLENTSDFVLIPHSVNIPDSVNPETFLGTSSKTSNIKKRALRTVDRITSVLSRTSSAPDHDAYVEGHRKGSLSRTASSPLANLPRGDVYCSNTLQKPPLDLPTLHSSSAPSSTIQSNIQYMRPTSISSSAPETVEQIPQYMAGLTPAIDNVPTTRLYELNNPERTKLKVNTAVEKREYDMSDCPTPVSRVHPEPIENIALVGPSQLKESKVCPICGENFNHLPMADFQTHVFDCYDRTDSVSGSRNNSGSRENSARVCPVCEARYPDNIPQQDYEHHVQQHFDEAPYNEGGYTILHP